MEHVRGIFFLSFDVKDFKLPCPFYYELLQWWSEFRDTFAEEKNYKNIILSNKEIKIDNKPVYFKNYREAGITYTHDLLFDRDINVALSSRTRKVNKINFLQWAGLRHSISSQLRYANVPLSTLSPSFTFEITLSILDGKYQKITTLYLFSERLTSQYHRQIAEGF